MYLLKNSFLYLVVGTCINEGVSVILTADVWMSAMLVYSKEMIKGVLMCSDGITFIENFMNIKVHNLTGHQQAHTCMHAHMNMAG